MPRPRQLLLPILHLKMGDYKKYLIITVVLFFAAILALFIATNIFVGKGGAVPADKNTPTEIKEEKQDIDTNSGPEIKIQPQTNIVFPLFRNKNGVFNPKELKVSPELSTKTCLITILNEDAEDLILRLSPYSPEDKVGFKYDSVPQSKSLTFDPRYGNLTQMAFHNRKNPEAEFRVVLDKACLE